MSTTWLATSSIGILYVDLYVVHRMDLVLYM